MAIMMKYEGIVGESTLAGFEGNIEIQSFSWGVSQPIAFSSGSKMQVAAERKLSRVSITKVMDGSSVLLVKDIFTNALAGVVEFTFARTGPGSGPATYANYKLEGCFMSSYTVASGGRVPVETIELAYEKITFTHYKFDDELKPVPDVVSYDLGTAQ